MLTFSLNWPLIIGLLVSTILPLLVGLVTTRVTHSGAKAALLALLAAVTGLLSELGNALTSQTNYDVGTGIVMALTSFLVAVGLHFGIYKPTGASAAAQSVVVTPRVDGGHNIR